jgi:signal peptidase I
MNPREHAAALACGLAGEVVRTFGEIRLRVFGTSMAPSILPGDFISVQRAILPEISSGEIVLYAREGRIFAHRAVGRTSDSEHALLITRGDRLRHNDPPVSSSELLGKVISIQRSSGQAKTTSQPGGFSCVLSRLLQSSDRATYLYVKLASFWGSLVSRTFSCRQRSSWSGGSTKFEGPGAARVATQKSEESSHEKFDVRLCPLETEGAAKCQV